MKFDLTVAELKLSDMTVNSRYKLNLSAGYTLLEALLVVGLLLLATTYVAWSWRGAQAAQTGVAASAQLAAALRERRASALRLLGGGHTGATPAEPVIINFSDLRTTAPLVIDGTDSDGNGRDDITDTELTRWTGNAWRYAYAGRAVKIPHGWRLALTNEDLGGIPPVPRSVITATVGFNEFGQTVPQPPAASPTAAEAPFWCVYLISVDGGFGFAIAVHGSGLVERWVWDGGARSWRGEGGRL